MAATKDPGIVTIDTLESVGWGTVSGVNSEGTIKETFQLPSESFVCATGAVMAMEVPVFLVCATGAVMAMEVWVLLAPEMYWNRILKA